MKRIRRRTRNRIIAAMSTLSVLVLGVIMVTVFSKADQSEAGKFLGDAIEFGIVADSVHQSAHMNTNLATNTYIASDTGKAGVGDSVGAGASGNGYILAGKISDYMDTEVAINVYTPKKYFNCINKDNGAEPKYMSAKTINEKVTGMLDASDTYAKSVLDKKTEGVELLTLPVSPKWQDNAPAVVEAPGEEPQKPEVVLEPEEPEEPVAPSSDDPDFDAKDAEYQKAYAEYQTEYAQYEEDLAAYNAYLKELADYKKDMKDYIDQKDAYEQYLEDKDDFDKKVEKFKAYNEEVAEFEKKFGNLGTIKNEYSFDISKLGDEVTGIDVSESSERVIYIQADDLFKYYRKGTLSSGALKIKKKDSQTIVFNVTKSGKLALLEYYVNDVQGGAANSDAAKSIIWNMPNASYVKLSCSNMSATVIAPKAGVDLIGVGQNSGWLVCYSLLDNDSEWHMMYNNMPSPPPEETKTPFVTGPSIDYTIEVTKAFEGGNKNWPDNAKFKFDIAVGQTSKKSNENPYDYSEDPCIDYSDLHSVTLTKGEPTQSMGTVRFDLKDFKGYFSNYYKDKGKDNTYYRWYWFKVTEDTKKPDDAEASGVDYDAIVYDTTPRYIKLFVNVQYKDSTCKEIKEYWIDAREAVGDDAECDDRNGATKFTNKLKPASPSISYDIKVTKAFEKEGTWPDGAKFKFDIAVGQTSKKSKENPYDYSEDPCIDYSDLHSVILTKGEPTQSMGTVRFDLKDFKGYFSNYYKDKGKDNTYYRWYWFKVTEDTKKPDDAEASGVDYDAIVYDTTPRYIKLFVNVQYKDSTCKEIKEYWIDAREAVGDYAECDDRNGATKFTNKLKPASPSISYDIKVTKAFEKEGTWPDGAKFKFDIAVGQTSKKSKENPYDYSKDPCIDYSDLHSVTLTKGEPIQSMGTVRFDLKDFKGHFSKYYKDKGKDNTYYRWYWFKVTEDTKKPEGAEASGVDYDAIVYDTTPRYIKLFVNVQYKDSTCKKIKEYWIDAREAVGDYAECDDRNGATKFTNKLKPTPPSIPYTIDVAKAFEGTWPEGAEFKFDISFDKAASFVTPDCVDVSGLSLANGIILTEKVPKKSMGTVKFDLGKFKGVFSTGSTGYSGKFVRGKMRGTVYCDQYMFTVTEDSTYRPADTKGVDYDSIIYDTTPRHIKIWVNVEKDKDGNIVDYWLEDREAIGNAECTERNGATQFTNRLVPPPSNPPSTTPPSTTTPPTTTTPPSTTTPPTTTTPPSTTTPPTTTTPPAAPTTTPLVEVEEFVPLAPATPEVTPTPQPEEIVPEEDVPLSKVPTKPKDKTPLVTVEEYVPLSATVPETGDSMNPIIPIAGMGLSLIAIIGVVVIRKKKML